MHDEISSVMDENHEKALERGGVGGGGALCINWWSYKRKKGDGYNREVCNRNKISVYK